MKARMTTCSVALSLALSLPGFALAAPPFRCSNATLKGNYVFTATGFTRAPGSAPGTPWAPKAILEVLQFNGNGTLSTPALTVANPFGDTGVILQPPAGAPGEYQVDSNCRGTVHFFDASNATFAIHVDFLGRRIQMIQVNPANNVSQGTADRVW